MKDKYKTLHQRKGDPLDEYYTHLETIEKELQYYDFRDKVVYCNCDDPEFSKFVEFFESNFDRLGLKKLICSWYGSSKIYETTGKYFTERELVFLDPGSFSDPACFELIDQADIIVSNPPFSKISDYLRTVMTTDYLFLGPATAVGYPPFYRELLKGPMSVGHDGKSKPFTLPSGKISKLGNVLWYTSLKSSIDKPFMELKGTYTGNEKDYPKLDTYDAIIVPNKNLIPSDYDGVMALPITNFMYINPDQFELLGVMISPSRNIYNLGAPILNGESKFQKLIVKLK